LAVQIQAVFVCSSDAQERAYKAPRAVEHSLTIRCRQNQVKAGSDISVEVVETNTSLHEIDTVFITKPPGLGELLYRAYVRNEKGDLVPETEYGREIRTGEVAVGSSSFLGSLKPGQSKIDTLILNKLYDLSQPGKYTVQVEGGDAKAGTKSNTITVVVTK